MVNDTCNNDPAPEQQSKHQQASTVNHVTKELHDTDALKKKHKKIFYRNYQYYIPAKANKKIEVNILKNANRIFEQELSTFGSL